MKKLPVVLTFLIVIFLLVACSGAPAPATEAPIQAVSAATATTAPTQTATPKATSTATSTPTSLPPSPTNTPSPTATPLPPTSTPTSTLTPTPRPTQTPTETFTPAPPTPTPLPPPPTNTPTPAKPPIAGKLAFPVDNGYNSYETWIVSLPDGQPLGRIAGASQPNFRYDGAKLLVNGEASSFGGKVFETDGNGNPERAVSGDGLDSYPVYKPDGTTLAYSNPQLAYGSQGYQWYLFVQCDLNTPEKHAHPISPDKPTILDQCAVIPDFGVLVPAGFIGDIIGSHPVWTAADMIAYKGCNTWAGGNDCGIFAVSSWATKRLSNGETPHKLVDGRSPTPTDSKVGLIAYHANETGDWEAYIVSQDGGQPVNISNSPSSRDSMPTLSPDGQWVAFASDRAGSWAVYVAPVSGGAAQKLFDFPKPNPWGAGERDWFNERMSWGP